MTRAWLLVLAAVACAAPNAAPNAASDAAAQRAALRHLFRERERNDALVVWVDAERPGPVFDALGAPAAPAVPDVAADTSLGTVVTLRAHDLDTLFRAHPDGWAAFFRQHPGATGLLEVSRVTRRAGVASVLVGRSCGEHCRQAWRVTVRRTAAGVWRASHVEFVRVPGA